MNESAREFRIGEALNFAFEAAVSNFLPFFLAIVITVASIGAWTLAVGLEFGFRALLTLGLGTFIRLAGQMFLGTYFFIGFVILSLKIADGKKIHIKDFFHNYHAGVPFFAASFLYFLAVSAGLFVLVVPGVIIAIVLFFYRFEVVDKGLGPIEALTASAELTRGVRFRIFVLFFVLGLVNMLGALCFFVGLLVTIPMSLVAQAWVYRRLQQLPSVEN